MAEVGDLDERRRRECGGDAPGAFAGGALVEIAVEHERRHAGYGRPAGSGGSSWSGAGQVRQRSYDIHDEVAHASRGNGQKK